MIKNSKEEILFTVHHFLNLYGETVEDVKDSSIIMCVAEDVFYPFSTKRLGKEVKIGDKFIKTTETMDVNSKVFPTIQLVR